MLLARVILLLVTVVFVVVTLVLHIIALVTSYWLRSSTEKQSNFLNIGLWTACFDKYVHPHENPERRYDGCHALSSDTYKTIRDWLVPSWLVSCQALSIVALILLVVGVVFVFFLLIWILCRRLICSRSKGDCCERCFLYATPIIFILAGMFLMMTAMIFADNAFRLQCKDFWVNGDDPYNNVLGHSWAVEVASCILCFISGLLLIWVVVLKGRDDDYN